MISLPVAAVKADSQRLAKLRCKLSSAKVPRPRSCCQSHCVGGKKATVTTAGPWRPLLGPSVDGLLQLMSEMAK